MSEFLQRVASAATQRCGLAPEHNILVAVSGGVDSMVLLHALHALARAHRWRIVVAHFNHQLRGRASDGDETLVRQTAERLHLPFVAGRADIQQLAAQAKISVEMAARQERHAFLARTAGEHHLSTIALAHHADDQVELFFLRLLRGAGGEGLAGMKWRSPSPANRNISLVRPLLAFTKAELLDHADANHVRYHEDATNSDTDILRNRIRQELLPLLRQQYQPGLDKTVLRLMEIVGPEAEFAAAAATAFRAGTRGGDPQPDNTKNTKAKKTTAAPPPIGHPPSAIGNSFAALPLAVQRKVLCQELAALGVMTDFELVEQLREAPGKPVSVATGVSVRRDGGGKVVRLEPLPATFRTEQCRLELSEQRGLRGRTTFAGREFQWRLAPQRRFKLPPKSTQPGPTQEYFDADQIGGELILRHWQPGDRFQPIGLKVAAKLQDLFVNAKIPVQRRHELVLAVNVRGEIFWVEGLRIGEVGKITPQTRRKLAWKVGVQKMPKKKVAAQA